LFLDILGLLVVTYGKHENADSQRYTLNTWSNSVTNST